MSFEKWKFYLFCSNTLLLSSSGLLVRLATNSFNVSVVQTSARHARSAQGTAVHLKRHCNVTTNTITYLHTWVAPIINYAENQTDLIFIMHFKCNASIKDNLQTANSKVTQIVKLLAFVVGNACFAGQQLVSKNYKSFPVKGCKRSKLAGLARLRRWELAPWGN